MKKTVTRDTNFEAAAIGIIAVTVCVISLLFYMNSTDESKDNLVNAVINSVSKTDTTETGEDTTDEYIENNYFETENYDYDSSLYGYDYCTEQQTELPSFDNNSAEENICTSVCNNADNNIIPVDPPAYTAAETTVQETFSPPAPAQKHSNLSNLKIVDSSGFEFVQNFKTKINDEEIKALVGTHDAFHTSDGMTSITFYNSGNFSRLQFTYCLGENSNNKHNAKISVFGVDSEKNEQLLYASPELNYLSLPENVDVNIGSYPFITIKFFSFAENEYTYHHNTFRVIGVYNDILS